MRVLLALVLLAGSANARARQGDAVDAITGKYPFYHTSSALADEASSLAASCSGLSVTSEADGSISVPVARLAALDGNGADQKQELKVVMVFGEHARELISPE